MSKKIEGGKHNWQGQARISQEADHEVGRVEAIRCRDGCGCFRGHQRFRALVIIIEASPVMDVTLSPSHGRCKCRDVRARLGRLTRTGKLYARKRWPVVKSLTAERGEKSWH